MSTHSQGLAPSQRISSPLSALAHLDLDKAHEIEKKREIQPRFPPAPRFPPSNELSDPSPATQRSDFRALSPTVERAPYPPLRATERSYELVPKKPVAIETLTHLISKDPSDFMNLVTYEGVPEQFLVSRIINEPTRYWATIIHHRVNFGISLQPLSSIVALSARQPFFSLGNWTVQYKERMVCRQFVTTRYNLTKSDELPRSFIHFQLPWMNNSIPDEGNFQPFIESYQTHIQQLNQSQDPTPDSCLAAPVVHLHCQAGHGRSGTLVFIRALMFQKAGTCAQNLLQQLRSQRIRFVETRSQYDFAIQKASQLSSQHFIAGQFEIPPLAPHTLSDREAQAPAITVPAIASPATASPVYSGLQRLIHPPFHSASVRFPESTFYGSLRGETAMRESTLELKFDTAATCKSEKPDSYQAKHALSQDPLAADQSITTHALYRRYRGVEPHSSISSLYPMTSQTNPREILIDGIASAFPLFTGETAPSESKALKQLKEKKRKSRCALL